MRISVKTKQGNEWPAVSGLYRIDDFLVLVDLKEKSDIERPDFYILNLDDWKKLILLEKERRPQINIDVQNRISYPDGWKGLNIKQATVQDAKEKWLKITEQVIHTT